MRAGEGRRSAARGWRRGVLAAALLIAPLTAWGETLEVERDWKAGWALTAFHGWFTDDATFGETISFDIEGMDSGYRFLGLAASKRIATVWSHLEIEGEGQFVVHYGDQQHFELVGAMVARWRR